MKWKIDRSNIVANARYYFQSSLNPQYTHLMANKTTCPALNFPNSEKKSHLAKPRCCAVAMPWTHWYLNMKMIFFRK